MCISHSTGLGRSNHSPCGTAQFAAYCHLQRCPITHTTNNIFNRCHINFILRLFKDRALKNSELYPDNNKEGKIVVKAFGRRSLKMLLLLFFNILGSFCKRKRKNTPLPIAANYCTFLLLCLNLIRLLW